VGKKVRDNLVYGHRETIDYKLIVGNLLNIEDINKVFEEYSFDGIVHFAAYALVGESMKKPSKYFQNNILEVLIS